MRRESRAQRAASSSGLAPGAMARVLCANVGCAWTGPCPAQPSWHLSSSAARHPPQRGCACTRPGARHLHDVATQLPLPGAAAAALPGARSGMRPRAHGCPPHVWCCVPQNLLQPCCAQMFSLTRVCSGTACHNAAWPVANANTHTPTRTHPRHYFCTSDGAVVAPHKCAAPSQLLVLCAFGTPGPGPCL